MSKLSKFISIHRIVIVVITVISTSCLLIAAHKINSGTLAYDILISLAATSVGIGFTVTIVDLLIARERLQRVAKITELGNINILTVIRIIKQNLALVLGYKIDDELKRLLEMQNVDDVVDNWENYDAFLKQYDYENYNVELNRYTHESTLSKLSSLQGEIDSIVMLYGNGLSHELVGKLLLLKHEIDSYKLIADVRDANSGEIIPGAIVISADKLFQIVKEVEKELGLHIKS